MQAFERIYRATGTILLNTVVLLLVIEFIAGFIENEKVGPAPHVIGAPDLAAYADLEWGDTYWEEHELALDQQYYPFVLWRRQGFQGEMINIHANGLRVVPGAQCEGDVFRVFVFGGSAVWGPGSPDWGTIPAYLQAQLDERMERPVCVVNFGESGYVGTQNLIALTGALQTGSVPDFVIFYDGWNDVYAAYQSGEAYGHQNQARIASLLQDDDPVPPLLSWLQSTQTYRVLNNVVSEPAAPFTYETLAVERGALARDIAANYTRLLPMLDALAEAYAFEYAVFWQPALGVGDKPVTDREEAMAYGLQIPFVTLLQDTYREVEDIEAEHFHNLTGVFDSVDEQVWIDAVHVLPRGNELVAARMLEQMDVSP